MSRKLPDGWADDHVTDDMPRDAKSDKPPGFMYTSGSMARVQLYVRSKRTSMVTGHVSMETIGVVHTTAEYAEGRTLAQLPQQDALAKDLLRKSGLKFDVVDLSGGIRTRLRARLKGVRRTPTLLDPNRSPQFLVGVKEISEYATQYKNTELSY